ncbi:hypothetical protein [Pseudomonas sp. PGPR40]|uniref:hypothetical protein n=1 Tax=Pseudomonas sp. PGPR40 TaxID=2913476 RepID=UPI001EDB21C8|nr:hypothetical protein [Pseudomonas sp. PGPR40]
MGSWLGNFDGAKGLVVLGHAGEDTFLTQAEQAWVIQSFKELVGGGGEPRSLDITGEGTQAAAEEAQRVVDAGASASLVYPSHGWLRFGYQKGAAQDD